MKKILLLMVALGFSSQAYAENIFEDLFRFKGVKPMNNDLYNDSCGECHYAYQAGLLPKVSWERMMLPEQLEDHFGENAELDEEDRIMIRDLLVANAADTSIYKRSSKIVRSLPDGKVELRITEVPYIKRKHKDLPDKYVKNNPKVKSLINCNACHRAIDKGIFDDDTILIPNYGYWSDIGD
ncbi:MAG: cytochrome C [Ghiorsea sp.]|nr:cytochrome C [Ghiorsea sp.]MDQ7057321.1 cytochrome C [Ghiorsea sp.]